MVDREKVLSVWPDAEVSVAFAKQKDGSRRWMYCVMSSLKFIASRGKKHRVLNVGSWSFSDLDAWSSAAKDKSVIDAESRQRKRELEGE